MGIFSKLLGRPSPSEDETQTFPSTRLNPPEFTKSEMTFLKNQEDLLKLLLQTIHSTNSLFTKLANGKKFVGETFPETEFERAIGILDSLDTDKIKYILTKQLNSARQLTRLRKGLEQRRKAS